VTPSISPDTEAAAEEFGARILRLWSKTRDRRLRETALWRAPTVLPPRAELDEARDFEAWEDRLHGS
jgi:hypothetical protein